MTKKKKTPKKNIESKTKSKIWILPALIIPVLIVAAYLYMDKTPTFNGENAYNDIVTQVNFGPRINGTEGHKKAREYFINKFTEYANKVTEHKFNYIDYKDSSKVYNGINIIASFNIGDDVTKRILLCAHYDTRPQADHDPDSTKRHLPVPGANDGGSGVAVLLEMARLFSIKSPNVGVDIVLFDLEDMGDEVNEEGVLQGNPFAIGSEEFVKAIPNYRPTYGILLDIVGDKNLSIPKEQYSMMRAGHIVDKVWAAAKKVGANAFKDEMGMPVYDDHFHFIRKGIPVIDLIQTPFPEYWHTTEDTPDKCSKESLQQVGDVLVEVIYSEE